MITQELVKMLLVASVPFAFFAMGCIKAHKERHIKTQKVVKEIEA